MPQQQPQQQPQQPPPQQPQQPQQPQPPQPQQLTQPPPTTTPVRPAPANMPHLHAPGRGLSGGPAAKYPLTGVKAGRFFLDCLENNGQLPEGLNSQRKSDCLKVLF